MSKIELGSVVQVGIVVRDALAAANAWTERFALEPAQVVDWPPAGSDMDAWSTFRGRRGNFRMRLAFIETGAVQIEFIEPLEGDNIYSEFLEEKGEACTICFSAWPTRKGLRRNWKWKSRRAAVRHWNRAPYGLIWIRRNSWAQSSN